MHPIRFPSTPLALGVLILIASHAQAQSSGQPVQTVVVTASADASAQGLPSTYAGGQVARGGRLGLLGNVDIMDAPFSATNYTLSLIQDQQAKGVADVVQNDPAVRVARGFGNYQELYVIRGFPVNSDDLAYNGLYGLLPRQFVASELLERVEVLRGANSFVNGATPGGGGIGGAINLLPKRAPNAPLNEVTVGVESGGQHYVAADVARRFGDENRAGIRINAVRREGGTAVQGEQRDLSVFSVGMDYRGRGYRLSADVGYQNHQLDDARPSVNVGAGLPVPAAAKADANWGQPWTRSDERDTFGTLRGEVDLGHGAVAWAAFGARRGDEANRLALGTTTSAAGDMSMYRFDNVRQDRVHTGEIGVRDSLETGAVKHTLSATASGFSATSRNAYGMSDWSGFATNLYRPVTVAPPPATFFVGGALDNPLVTSKNILSSFALADTMSFDDGRVLVTAGARRQTIKSYGYDYTTGAENARYDRSAVTPLAAIVYKPVKAVSLYANYAEALQQGPVASGTQIDNPGQVFAPYTSRQKEVGVKYDGGKLGMTAALFTISQPMGYVQDHHFGVFGEQRNRGLELSVFGMPVRGLRVLGGLTLIDATQQQTAGGVNQGKDVIGVPRSQLNFGTEWDVPGMSGLSLNARALYTSTQYADAANLQQVPAWSRFDVGAAYRTRIAERDVTLRARFDNVTNRRYWASAGGYPGSGYLVQGAPRTAGLTATVDF